METKEFVKKKIGEIELWMMDYKADYPKDENECWRKRMPLLLGLSITAPLLLLAIRCNVWALYWAVPMAWVLILLSTYMLRSKYKSKATDSENVRQSINILQQLGQYAEIVEYGNRKQKEADSILNSKAEYRNNVNRKSIGIVLASNIALILIIILFCKPYTSPTVVSATELNPNFAYLGISNHQQFDVEPLSTEVLGCDAVITSQKCKIAIEDPWSDGTDPESYAYLYITGLEVSNLDADCFYCLKLVDDSALPIPYMPDFLFSENSLRIYNCVYSSLQDSENEKFDNLMMMSNLSSQNPKFIIRKIY